VLEVLILVCAAIEHDRRETQRVRARGQRELEWRRVRWIGECGGRIPRRKRDLVPVEVAGGLDWCVPLEARQAVAEPPKSGERHRDSDRLGLAGRVRLR